MGPRACVVIAAAVGALVGCGSSTTSTGAGAGPSDGGQSGNQARVDGGCAWSGTWATAWMPLSGDCSSETTFSGVQVDADGGLSTGSASSPTACRGGMPTPSTCQIGALCAQWLVALNLSGCPGDVPCSGTAVDIGSHGDGGACTESFTLTRTGP